MKVTYILNELLSILNVIQERIYVFLIVNLFLARNKVESNIFFGFSGKQKNVLIRRQRRVQFYKPKIKEIAFNNIIIEKGFLEKRKQKINRS